MTAATATRKPVIPAPTDRRMVNAAVHTRLSVGLDDFTVVYAYDTTSIVLSLVDRSEWMSATELDRSIRKQTTLGRKVFHGDVECGGGLSDYHSPKLTATPDEISTLLQAIPHFYQCLDDAQERKTLRGVYRWLTKHAATD